MRVRDNISNINHKLYDSKSWFGYSHTFTVTVKKLSVFCFGLGCKALNEMFIKMYTTLLCDFNNSILKNTKFHVQIYINTAISCLHLLKVNVMKDILLSIKYQNVVQMSNV